MFSFTDGVPAAGSTDLQAIKQHLTIKWNFQRHKSKVLETSHRTASDTDIFRQKVEEEL